MALAGPHSELPFCRKPSTLACPHQLPPPLSSPRPCVLRPLEGVKVKTAERTYNSRIATAGTEELYELLTEAHYESRGVGQPESNEAASDGIELKRHRCLGLSSRLPRNRSRTESLSSLLNGRYASPPRRLIGFPTCDSRRSSAWRLPDSRTRAAAPHLMTPQSHPLRLPWPGRN